MDLQEISQLIRDQLTHLLESTPGGKDLVIDGDLTKPLDRVAGAKFLKQHGVEKIFKLDMAQKSLPPCSKRVYLVRPKMVVMKYIADHINDEKRRNVDCSYSVIFVPRKVEVCERILEREGVHGLASLEELALELFPLDSDLLSLHMPDLFRTFYLDGDMTGLHTVASSLVNLQALFGRIPEIHCIGRGSRMVYDLMQAMFGLTEPSGQQVHISKLFIVDRDVDYVTPLCSPMTYEALLDETFGIDCGYVDLATELTAKESVKLLLTSQDEIYEQIRNKHFSSVSGFLSVKAKELQTIHDKKNNLKTVGDMKDFVAKDLRALKQQHKMLAHHIDACEAIMKKKAKSDFEEFIQTEHTLLDGTDYKENFAYIEECIAKQFNVLLTLRLLCLLSLSQDGLSARDYKLLRTEFLQSHGFEYLLTFYNLKRLGLLAEQEVAPSGKPLSNLTAAIGRRSQFSTLSKKLALVPKASEEMNLRSPNDMSYVFSGAYTPLICKLVELILTRRSTQGMEDTLRLIPGGVHSTTTKATGPTVAGADKSVLVYFLGGCTFSEIAALRFLQRSGWRVLVATTSIFSGNSFMETLREQT